MKILPCLLLLLAAACDNGKPTALAPPTSDLGTGLNTVDRRYPKAVPDVLHAASTAVNALGLHVDGEKSDALGGEITARRANDQKVVLTVKTVDASTSSVSVRVAPGDRNMANLVHEKIAAGLGLAEAGGEGESVKDAYPDSLAACVAAAEKALKAMRHEVVDRQSSEDGADLQARGEDSIPSSFRFRKAADGRTEVTITSGTAKGLSYRERRDQLKAAFEKALAGAKGGGS